MRICKRCKTNEAVKGSLNCDKCNERNRKYTATFISEINLQKKHSSVVGKSINGYDAYGGLGREWDKGVAGHLENF